MTLVVLTGASGSGKTTLAQAMKARLGRCIEILFFDSIGIPSAEQMVAEFGSAEEWQRSKTIKWMQRIAPVLDSRRNVLFEGQARISFLDEGIAAAGIVGYRIALVDCDDTTRIQRFKMARGQPDLASQRMLEWAGYLRGEAERGGHEILDTSVNDLDACTEWICRQLEN